MKKANDQHSPTPTPSASAADPPHRGEGMCALMISENLIVKAKRLPIPSPLWGGVRGGGREMLIVKR